MIEQFTANKLAVFPLVRRSKKPTKSSEGFPNFNYEDNETRKDEIWVNIAYGVSLTEDWIVVDYDIYKEGAEQSFERLKELGLSTNGFCVQSARGGFHYYFKNPTKQPIRKHIKEQFPGIDFLSTGMYTVGPGTITLDGEYKIIQGVLADAPDFPASILEILVKTTPILSNIQLAVDVPVEIQRFREYLSQHEGATKGNRGLETYKVAGVGKDFGLSEATVYEEMQVWNEEKLNPPLDDDEFTFSIKNAYKYGRNTIGVAATNTALFNAVEPPEDIDTFKGLSIGWDILPNNKLKNTTRNLMNLLQLREVEGYTDGFAGLVYMNTNEHRIEFSRKPFWRSPGDDSPLVLKDSDLPVLKAFFAMAKQVDYSTTAIYEGFEAIATRNRKHPIRDWLNSLRWDGKQRLARLFLEYFNEPDFTGNEVIYREAVATAFILASIWRIFHPGYLWRHMLVLSGPQYVAKSLFVNLIGGGSLNPNDGVTGYSKELSKMSSDPETLKKMQGAWFIEFAEMSAYKKSDIDEIKAFISTRKDTFRASYGRIAEDKPRQQVFVWTLNPVGDQTFLKDQSGNSRFLVLDVEKLIDVQAIARDREQIFAEAMVLYRQGVRPENLLVERIVAEIAKEKQEDRLQDPEDAWLEPIRDWLDENYESLENWKDRNTKKVTANKILQEAIGIHMVRDLDQKSKLRVAAIMRQLGWNRSRSAEGRFYYKEFESKWEI